MKRTLIGIGIAVAAVLVLPMVTHHTPHPNPAAATASPAARAQVPTVDYTTTTTGTVAPNDAEYVQYRNVVPDSDPLGPVIPAPPAGSPPAAWRAFAIAQCTRWGQEPPWYRRGAGCHVTTDPAIPAMVIDPSATETADLDRAQQDRIDRVCGAATKLGYDCNVITKDGP